MEEFDYMLLLRLKQDCNYYLGAGGRNTKHLWSLDEAAHIKKMQEIFDGLSKKPEWISLEDIENYKKEMLPSQQSGITDDVQAKEPDKLPESMICLGDLLRHGLLEVTGLKAISSRTIAPYAKALESILLKSIDLVDDQKNTATAQLKISAVKPNNDDALDPNLQIVEQVCNDFDGNGICSVGAIGALRAMSHHWKDHLAEGHSPRIISEDIDEMKQQLEVMRAEIMTRIASQQTPIPSQRG